MVMSLRPLFGGDADLRQRGDHRAARTGGELLDHVTRVGDEGEVEVPHIEVIHGPAAGDAAPRTPPRTTSLIAAVFWCLPMMMALSFCQSMKYVRSQGRRSKTYCSAARFHAGSGVKVPGRIVSAVPCVPSFAPWWVSIDATLSSFGAGLSGTHWGHAGLGLEGPRRSSGRSGSRPPARRRAASLLSSASIGRFACSGRDR